MCMYVYVCLNICHDYMYTCVCMPNINRNNSKFAYVWRNICYEHVYTCVCMAKSQGVCVCMAKCVYTGIFMCVCMHAIHRHNSEYADVWRNSVMSMCIHVYVGLPSTEITERDYATENTYT